MFLSVSVLNVPFRPENFSTALPSYANNPRELELRGHAARTRDNQGEGFQQWRSQGQTTDFSRLKSLRKSTVISTVWFNPSRDKPRGFWWNGDSRLGTYKLVPYSLEKLTMEFEYLMYTFPVGDMYYDTFVFWSPNQQQKGFGWILGISQHSPRYPTLKSLNLTEAKRLSIPGTLVPSRLWPQSRTLAEQDSHQYHQICL
ncbi:uncharacterized protein CC84DRAFT_419315 [Paraphaeosphaeria sporulosa]|uniref:Uncharacterized protein n=1 Tax=Paraphaeosphaeria sporulosa TaxID=1460663 RepID=A0A177BUK7_9PLEO|nr:uncharacterized protein CC84DRAFT_419315 [Paraphaeosphaeria sporulosa]OAF99143.1 hypothetical protein CC84DRAFT_419315 [Paraphaeosphaeria sporulosa]